MQSIFVLEIYFNKQSIKSSMENKDIKKWIPYLIAGLVVVIVGVVIAFYVKQAIDKKIASNKASSVGIPAPAPIAASVAPAATSGYHGKNSFLSRRVG